MAIRKASVVSTPPCLAIRATAAASEGVALWSPNLDAEGEEADFPLFGVLRHQTQGMGGQGGSGPSFDEGAMGAPGGSRGTVRGPVRSRLPRPSSFVSQATILRLAEGGAVPRGRVRPAGGGLPAGIEIIGGELLGVGLQPGDRLVGLDGVSVADQSAVVSHVLSARGRGASTIRADLVRAVSGVAHPFVVVVEQPYPEAP